MAIVPITEIKRSINNYEKIPTGVVDGKPEPSILIF